MTPYWPRQWRATGGENFNQKLNHYPMPDIVVLKGWQALVSGAHDRGDGGDTHPDPGTPRSAGLDLDNAIGTAGSATASSVHAASSVNPSSPKSLLSSSRLSAATTKQSGAIAPTRYGRSRALTRSASYAVGSRT